MRVCKPRAWIVSRHVSLCCVGHLNDLFGISAGNMTFLGEHIFSILMDITYNKTILAGKCHMS